MEIRRSFQSSREQSYDRSSRPGRAGPGSSPVAPLLIKFQGCAEVHVKQVSGRSNRRSGALIGRSALLSAMHPPREGYDRPRHAAPDPVRRQPCERVEANQLGTAVMRLAQRVGLPPKQVGL